MALKIKKQEPLSSWTSFKIGGPAEYFCAVKNQAELAEALTWAKQKKIPWFIIGGGSNVLASDDGFKGLVIKIDFIELVASGAVMKIASGASLASVVKMAADRGLSGLEWAVGIPGTIGGAIVGNAGAYGGEMKNVVKEVIVWRLAKQTTTERWQAGREKVLSPKACHFSYRQSIFKNQKNYDIILAATLALKKAKPAAVREKMRAIATQRAGKFDAFPSAGSIFKKVFASKKFAAGRVTPAGWLIEQCGLKGEKIGAAQISPKHANIIINRGRARAEEVRGLIELAKKKVKKKFGLILKEEIIYLGFKK